MKSKLIKSIKEHLYAFSGGHLLSNTQDEILWHVKEPINITHLVGLIEDNFITSWQPIDAEAKTGADVILGTLTYDLNGDAQMINIAADYWYTTSSGVMGWFEYLEWFHEDPTHYLIIPQPPQPMKGATG